MKQFIAIIATALSVSAFAADAPKSVPETAVVKAEVAKAPATKSPAKQDAKKTPEVKPAASADKPAVTSK